MGSQKSSYPLLKRDFQTIEECDGETIRVMQWNILAQAMSGVEDNFIRCPPEAVVWTRRREHILEEILRCKPTIVCLEEVDVFEYLLENLASKGYLGVFYPKPDSPCLMFEDNTGPDGCSIFYNTSKLTLSTSRNIILRDGTDYPTNQVCIIADFQTTSGEAKSFSVAVTHLKSKHGYEDLREEQGMHFVQKLSKHCPDGPVIVCGDFNAEPTEKVYRVMKSSNLGLHSAYTYLSPEKEEPVFTTFKYRPNGKISHTIDYIWFSNEKLKLKSVWKLPTEAEIGENGLPSLTYPSDHLALAADFVLA